MQLFKQETTFKFMAKRKLAMMFSITLIVISLASMATRGFNFGIDFTGGTLVEVGYPEAVEVGSIRDIVAGIGFEGAEVIHFGSATEILIRLAPSEGMSSAEASEKLMSALQAEESDAQMRRQEFVGPKVGEELVNDGGLAMLIALICILIYVGLRFEKGFALGSVAALVHDVLITLGVFSILQMNFDLTVLAAVLAVIGYSLNDTIVVFDRIRENFRLLRKADTIEVIDTSLNQTLSRTLMTSVTTLLVLIALFVFGGELINAFASALIVGVLVGTYSSIYVAATTALAMGISRESLMPVEKEGAEFEDPGQL